ncbi:MAG: hypothetical protein AB8G05_22495 [Oligoflexales bacterium]
MMKFKNGLVGFFIFSFLSFPVFANNVPAKVYVGLDCSAKSIAGEFGKNTYGGSLYKPQAAFTKPKGASVHGYTESVQAPMSWALHLASEAIFSYEYKLDDCFFSIGHQTGHEKDQVLNLLELSRELGAENIESKEDLVANIKLAIDYLIDDNFGIDFNPIPFMKMVVGQFEQLKKPKLVLGVIFTSGDIEDSKREELTRFLEETSFLPIKWTFMVIGRDHENNEISRIIKKARKASLFDNATVLSFDSYFDFDMSIGAYSKFDIRDSLKQANKTKLLRDINKFLLDDYETKVRKLIKAKETSASCFHDLDELVEKIE